MDMIILTAISWLVQDWIYQLDPMTAFLLMTGVFLIAVVGGWYFGEAILRLLRGT